MAFYKVHNLENLPPRLLDDYLARGWYRMKQTVFTVSHQFNQEVFTFQKLWWLRYNIPKISPNRIITRMLTKNTQFSIEIHDPFIHDPELQELYTLYQGSIQFEGYPSIESATFSPGTHNHFDTKAMVVRYQGKAIACGIFDLGETAVASILHFYDPSYKRHSLGKYLMFLTVEYGRYLGLEWYYPGYVIAGNPKMDYKLFLGKEIAEVYDYTEDGCDGQWIPFHDDHLKAIHYPQERWVEDFKAFF